MSGSVLIVDDSLTVRMDLLEAFLAAGFHGVPCASAAEAREALARLSVDAIVLDVLLPDADGMEFLTELRASAEHRHKPIVFLSTEAEVPDRIRGLSTGADEYIGKPYDAGYLVAVVRNLMGANRSDQRGAPAVLVIDDSLTFRMAMQRLLEDKGYQVFSAGTGEEGLHVAADRRPDAILVDGMLPGIDGATVIRRVRMDAALRDIPCLLLTASTDSDIELRVLDAGADAFVRKDEDVAIVLAKLAVILRRHTATRQTDDPSSLHGPKRILAVDDSQAYLAETSGKLREHGYEVVLARTGVEALQLLAAQSVDCVLLDLLLPGLDGRETCQRIKAASPARDVPVIMLTSNDDPGAMLDILDVGADDYVRKSDGPVILEARVRTQIRRKQAQDESRRIREQVRRRGTDAAEALAARELAATRTALVEALERQNRELETFSYSVAHDLRGPLQIVEGYSEELQEDSAHLLDNRGRHCVARINAAAQRMGHLVSALLQLAHASRADLRTEKVDLSALAREVGDELRRGEPGRKGRFDIEESLLAQADPHLVRALLANVLGNAWKFTGLTEMAVIEVGSQLRGGQTTYYVRDNGAGFRAGAAEALFRPFGRAHDDHDFPGSGIGLATAIRIVDRHGGRIWAESEVGNGATFYFTLTPGQPSTKDPLGPGPIG